MWQSSWTTTPTSTSGGASINSALKLKLPADEQLPQRDRCLRMVILPYLTPTAGAKYATRSGICSFAAATNSLSSVSVSFPTVARRAPRSLTFFCVFFYPIRFCVYEWVNLRLWRKSRRFYNYGTVVADFYRYRFSFASDYFIHRIFLLLKLYHFRGHISRIKTHFFSILLAKSKLMWYN